MAKTFKALRNPRLGLDDQIPGRHFGYTIHEIIKDRPEYIDWLMKNTEILFHDSVYDLMDEIYPEIKPFKIPYDMTYPYFMDEDVPF